MRIVGFLIVRLLDIPTRKKQSFFSSSLVRSNTVQFAQNMYASYHIEIPSFLGLLSPPFPSTRNDNVGVWKNETASFNNQQLKTLNRIDVFTSLTEEKQKLTSKEQRRKVNKILKVPYSGQFGLFDFVGTN